MNQSQAAPLVGTFRALVDAGEESFSVIVEVKEPVTGSTGLEQRIEGLVGERLRNMVKRPSEAVFVNEIEPIAAADNIADPLDQPIENPTWWPGAKIVSIKRVSGNS